MKMINIHTASNNHFSSAVIAADFDSLIYLSLQK